MPSQSGQNSTTKALSREDVCVIIRIAGASGVCSLKYGCLGVTFFPKEKVSLVSAPIVQKLETNTAEPEISPEVTSMIKAAMLDEMMIRNPAEYEEWATSEDALPEDNHGRQEADSET